MGTRNVLQEEQRLVQGQVDQLLKAHRNVLQNQTAVLDRTLVDHLLEDAVQEDNIDYLISPKRPHLLRAFYFGYNLVNHRINLSGQLQPVN